MVNYFGYKNCSDSVKEQYKSNPYNWIDIIHLIEPNPQRDSNKVDAVNKPFTATYVEMSKKRGNDGVLRKSGFDEMPVATPRWDPLER